MSDFQKFINDDKPTLVDFFATWCGPCRMQGPILEQLKQKLGDSVNIIKIDIDNNQALAAEYNVRSVPTLMVFRGGEVKWRTAGLTQADVLEQQINAAR